VLQVLLVQLELKEISVVLGRLVRLVIQVREDHQEESAYKDFLELRAS